MEKGQLEANLKTRDGKKALWQSIRPAADGYLDLAAFHAGKQANSYSYLTAEIKSETAQNAVVLLGADDGSRVWINGQRVHEQNGKSAASPAMFKIPIQLKAGANQVLIKITNGDGPHGAYLTILSEGQLTE